jgi:hypothetical protein
MLEEVVVAVKTLITRRVRTLEGFFVSVDGSNVPLQMLTATEALATILHFAYIDSALFTFYGLPFGNRVFSGWYTSPTTLLCQIWNWYRGCGAYPWPATFSSE